MRKARILIIELIAWDSWLNLIILMYDLFVAVDCALSVASELLAHQAHVLVPV